VKKLSYEVLDLIKEIGNSFTCFTWKQKTTRGVIRNYKSKLRKYFSFSFSFLINESAKH
jgi:hypothetical protein